MAYVFRILNPHKKNYVITELETLALVWALKQFRPYILGDKCKVFTDHSACSSLLNTPDPSTKLARWAMNIQDLNLAIKYPAGERNVWTHFDIITAHSVRSKKFCVMKFQFRVLTMVNRPSHWCKTRNCTTKTPWNSTATAADLNEMILCLKQNQFPDDATIALKIIALESLQYKLCDAILYHNTLSQTGIWSVAVQRIWEPSWWRKLTV